MKTVMVRIFLPGKRSKRRHGPDGKFIRTRKPWSLANFGDGYIGSDGRMRVYFPGHKRASSMGYIMRSIVAYEAYHGVEVTKDFAVHHKDGNRSNDARHNLELIEFGEHSRMHFAEKRIRCTCNACEEDFFLPKWRIDDGRGKFCSQECWHSKGMSNECRRKISAGLRRAYREGRR